MKVLHIINSLNFGGAEKLLYDCIPKFKAQGLDVNIMVLYGKKTFFYNTLEKQHNIKIIKPKKIISIYNISHILHIRKVIKHYDIVHVHLFPALYWVALASIFLKKSPKLLLTEHNTVNRRRNSKVFKYLDQQIYKNYQTVIAISKGVKINLEQHLGKNNYNIITINNGVDTHFFNQAKAYLNTQLNIPNKAKLIIQISSFYPQKDQDTLIKAAALLEENIHVLLVGDGALINEKKKLAITLNIGHRVHFLGYRNDVERLLKTAHICVLSSHYEGFGLAAVEGMASGIPCIASNLKGLREVVKNAGILFEVGNHLELKKIIEQLFLDQAYYDSIANKCRNRAKQYDISLMIRQHLNLYSTLND